MEEHEIHILPQLKPAYNNHLKMMLERFKNNQCTSLVGKEGTESVSEENLKLAQQLLTPLFQKYAIHPNETEEVLIALYIQVSKKEGEKK
jgi:transcriptional regulatory protein LevR